MRYQARVSIEKGPSALNSDKRTSAYILASSIGELSDMSPVSFLTGTEMNQRTKDLPTQISEIFNSVGGKVERAGFGNVILGEYGVGGILNHKPINRAKMVTLVSVPEVIKHGRMINYDPNWKGRGYASAIFAAPVRVAEKTIYVAAVVDIREGNKFYLNECVDSEGNYVRLKEDPSDNTKSGVTVQDGITRGPEGSSGSRVTQPGDKSKTRKQAREAMPEDRELLLTAAARAGASAEVLEYRKKVRAMEAQGRRLERKRAELENAERQKGDRGGCPFRLRHFPQRGRHERGHSR